MNLVELKEINYRAATYNILFSVSNFQVGIFIHIFIAKIFIPLGCKYEITIEVNSIEIIPEIGWQFSRLENLLF